MILCGLAIYLVSSFVESCSVLGQSACLSAVCSNEGSAYAKEIMFQEGTWKMGFLRKTLQNITVLPHFFAIPLH